MKISSCKFCTYVVQLRLRSQLKNHFLIKICVDQWDTRQWKCTCVQGDLISSSFPRSQAAEKSFLPKLPNRDWWEIKNQNQDSHTWVLMGNCILNLICFLHSLIWALLLQSNTFLFFALFRRENAQKRPKNQQTWNLAKSGFRNDIFMKLRPWRPYLGNSCTIKVLLLTAYRADPWVCQRAEKFNQFVIENDRHNLLEWYNVALCCTMVWLATKIFLLETSFQFINVLWKTTSSSTFLE